MSQCVILRQELTENNLRKWRVRYDQCQRCVADKTCRFLIRRGTVHFWTSTVVLIPKRGVLQGITTPNKIITDL
jgi:hypothetical protein